MRYGEKAIKKIKLEVWDNPSCDRDYKMNILYPEFACLCQRSAYPDFATIKATYIPDKKVIELNVPIFYTTEILRRLL